MVVEPVTEEWEKSDSWSRYRFSRISKVCQTKTCGNECLEDRGAD